MKTRLSVMVSLAAGCASLTAACGDGASDVPNRCVPFERHAPMMLDGPLVSLGTTWGAISNGTTYVQFDEQGDVIAQATLPAAAGPQKRALIWNGQQVAAYLANGHLAMFAADGSDLREGSWVGPYPEGVLRATVTGYAAVSTRWQGEPLAICKLDSNGALIGTTACPDVSGPELDPRTPVTITQTAGGLLVITKKDCGGPGIGLRYCPGFAGGAPSLDEFYAPSPEGLGLDADDDGTTTLVVAFRAPEGGAPTDLNGAVWSAKDSGKRQLLNVSPSRSLGVAWTGSFWETIALGSSGIIEERLDRDLRVTSRRDLASMHGLGRTPLVVSNAHGALIVISPALGPQTMIQVCY